MSIIYDALKKVERSTNKDIITEVNKKRSASKLTSYLLYALVVCAGIFAANMMFGIFSPEKTAPAPKETKIVPLATGLKTAKIAKPAAKETLGPVPPKAAPPVIVEAKIEPMIPPLMLNGVFFSKNQGYALINNKVVKQGDSVEGIKVRKVNLDDVELETSTGVKFKLTTQSR